jgi:hypothetical protein
MNSTNIRPRWWQLYLAFPLLITLFFVDNRLRLSTRGHQAVQIAILVVVYSLVHLWLKANARALSRMDQQAYRGTVRIIRVPWTQAFEPEEQRRTILHLPDSEIKGLLSETADLSHIDAESTPVHEVDQN